MPPQRPRASRRRWLLGLGGAFLDVNELLVSYLSCPKSCSSDHGRLTYRSAATGPTHKTQIVSRSSRRRRRPRAAPRSKSNTHAWVCGRSAPNQPTFGPPCAARPPPTNQPRGASAGPRVGNLVTSPGAEKKHTKGGGGTVLYATWDMVSAHWPREVLSASGGRTRILTEQGNRAHTRCV